MKKHKKNYLQNKVQILIKQKANAFIKAEKTYWKYRKEIQQKHKENIVPFDFEIIDSIPESFSSRVYALKDGVAFVRYKVGNQKPKFDFIILEIDLQKWGEEFLLIPTLKGDFSLAKANIIKGYGNLSIANCNFSGVQIDFAEISHLKYGETNSLPTVESAILDFQYFLLGLQFKNKDESLIISSSEKNVVENLKKIKTEFENLLKVDNPEETLQVFL